MSVAHTPGPWRALRDTDAKDNLGYKIDSGEVSMLAWVPRGAEASDYNANARLIAAAPDLLEALDLLLNDYVRLAEESGCDLIGSNLDPEVARARAALAKARGQ